MSLLRKMKAFGDRPPTLASVTAIFGVTIAVFVALMLVVDHRSGNRVESERADRGQDKVENRDRDERLSRRLVAVELGDPVLCARSTACRRAVRKRQAPPERREKREARKPEQVADRPPRQPAKPPTVPEPDTGGGDPPNDPSVPSAPNTPSQTSPPPVVQIDPPAVDVDGPDGLLPNIVNLPPIDVPPVRLP